MLLLPASTSERLVCNFSRQFFLAWDWKMHDFFLGRSGVPLLEQTRWVTSSDLLTKESLIPFLVLDRLALLPFPHLSFQRPYFEFWKVSWPTVWSVETDCLDIRKLNWGGWVMNSKTTPLWGHAREFSIGNHPYLYYYPPFRNLQPSLLLKSSINRFWDKLKLCLAFILY